MGKSAEKYDKMIKHEDYCHDNIYDKIIPKESNVGRFPGVLVAGFSAQPVLLNKILHSVIKT